MSRDGTPRAWRARAGLLLDIAWTGLRRAPTIALVPFLAALGGTLVVLGAAATIDVALDRAEVTAARMPIVGDEDGLRVQVSEGRFAGRSIHVVDVWASDPTSHAAPGVTRMPRAGELVVSPAFGELRRREGSTLANRYPGDVVATVGPSGLLGPHELVVWVGRDDSELSPDLRVSGFGTDAADVLRVPSDLRVAVPVLVVVFLLPVVILFATAAAIGAERRERRLAALRLLGLSRTSARGVVVLESVIPVLPGVLAAALVLRPAARWAAPSLPFDGGVWPGMVDVSLPALLAATATVLGVATVVVVGALRRLDVGPLAVLRRASMAGVSRARGWPLAVGLALLAGSVVAMGAQDDVEVAAWLFIAALAGVLVGVPVATPLVVRWCASVTGRLTGSWVAELASARVAQRPERYARVVAGSAVVVLVSGLLLSLLPLLAGAESADLRAARASTVDDLVLADVQDRDGEVDGHEVAAVVRVDVIQVAVGPDVRAVAVVDCAALGELLVVDPPCVPGGAALVWDAALPPGSQVVRERVEPDGTITYDELGAVGRLPVQPTSDTFEQIRELLPANGGVIDRSALDPITVADAAVHATVLVLPGAHGTEAARTAVAPVRPDSALTLEERIQDAERTSITYRRITIAVVAAAGAMAAMLLCAALLAEIAAQRRERALLRVVGVREAELARSTVAQAALAAVPGVALSWLLAVALCAVFLALDGSGPARIPWGGMGAIAAGALLLPLVASTAVLPAMRTTHHRDLSRD